MPSEAAILLKKSCERIQQIADDLLKRQRQIHANKLAFAPILLIDPIIDAITEAKLRTPELTIDFEGNNSMPHCFANIEPDALRRIISNVINNSVEAAGNGAQIKIGIEMNRSMVSILVDDNGPGFPSEVLHQIGEMEVTTKINGHGLGLIFAAKQLNNWGGKITFLNIKPHGARVSIMLPIDEKLIRANADLEHFDTFFESNL
jgi:signal transduction histidine kinase